MGEVQSFLKMLGEVYGMLGLDYTMALSTRCDPAPCSVREACRDAAACLQRQGGLLACGRSAQTTYLKCTLAQHTHAHNIRNMHSGSRASWGA